MIIQNVCLSINKLCNDALHFVFLFCIYYFQVVFHEIQFRHTFELNYGYITSIFVCKAFQIRGLILPKLLL